MGDVLNQPFVSEAYDRLMVAQAQAPKPIQRQDVTILDTIRFVRVMDCIEASVTDLRSARETLGLSQAQFAERLGTDGPRISKLENGAPIPAYIDLAVRCLLAVEACK